MSLRLRLLVAVGLIAIVALVVADFATYSALRSSLYNQVDQELAHPAHFNVDSVTGTAVGCPSPQSDFGGAGPVGNSGGGPGPGGGDNFPNVFGISYIGVVEPERQGRPGLRVPRLRWEPPLPPPAALAHQRLHRAA